MWLLALQRSVPDRQTQVLWQQLMRLESQRKHQTQRWMQLVQLCQRLVAPGCLHSRGLRELVRKASTEELYHALQHLSAAAAYCGSSCSKRRCRHQLLKAWQSK